MEVLLWTCACPRISTKRQQRAATSPWNAPIVRLVTLSFFHMGAFHLVRLLTLHVHNSSA
jgi:hypothetical protein